VTCVIVGLSKNKNIRKYIFDKSGQLSAENINGYLIDAPNVCIKARANPMSALPPMDRGSSPIDGGGLLLRPVDLCCTHFAQQYIGSHIIENASDTILA
jgi:hypothetical protein